MALGGRDCGGGWLTVTIGVPLIGVALRAFISNWGVGVSLWDELAGDVP
jgi:ABC-type Fe3+ transport system permease subunit